jgi:hypothetical protein
MIVTGCIDLAAPDGFGIAATGPRTLSAQDCESVEPLEPIYSEGRVAPHSDKACDDFRITH